MIMQTLYTLLIKPRAQTEDNQRREFILNFLILGSLGLSFIAFLMTLVGAFVMGPNYQGTPPLILLVICLFFGLLLVLSRVQYHKLVAYVFITLYFSLATMTLLLWGISLPQGLLMYAMLIVIAGIVVSSRFAFGVTFVIAASLIGISYLHTRGVIQPNLFWIGQTPKVSDAIVFIVSLGVITLVSWLSNREIEKSLKRARRSEAALQKERDLLEIRVEERTQALKKEQADKIEKLTAFAEMGQNAAGLIHDLANPLSTVSFSLEQLNEQDRTELSQRALQATDYMKHFLKSVRSQLQNQQELVVFSVAEEIDHAFEIVAYRARKATVTLKKPEMADSLKLYGDPAKFSRLIANLLSNAIDAYAACKQPKRDKTVRVEIQEQKDSLVILVQDWACGIPKHIQSKIFDPFVTTKSTDQGTGIGLATAKRVVEGFDGTITFETKQGEGTTFIVSLPLGARTHARPRPAT